MFAQIYKDKKYNTVRFLAEHFILLYVQSVYISSSEYNLLENFTNPIPLTHFNILKQYLKWTLWCYSCDGQKWQNIFISMKLMYYVHHFLSGKLNAFIKS